MHESSLRIIAGRYLVYAPEQAGAQQKYLMVYDLATGSKRTLAAPEGYFYTSGDWL